MAIPNREIAAVYKNEILSHLLQIGAITRTTANKIAESLYASDLRGLQKGITEYMNKSLAAEALQQIDDKRYDSEMKEEGVTSILKLGIAFSGKKVRIRTK